MSVADRLNIFSESLFCFFDEADTPLPYEKHIGSSLLFGAKNCACKVVAISCKQFSMIQERPLPLSPFFPYI